MKDKNIFSVLSSGMASVVLSTIYSMLLARLLSVSDRGVVQFIVSNITVCSAVILGGAGQTVAYAYKSGERLSLTRVVLTIFPVLAIIFAATIAFGGAELHNYAPEFVTQIGAFGVTLFCLDVSKSEKTLNKYFNITIAQALISAILFAGIFSFTRSISAAKAIYAMTCAALLTCAYALYEVQYVAKYFENNVKVGIGKFRKYLVKQWLLQSLGACVKNIDKIAIGLILDKEVLGMYAICVAFDAVPSRLYQSLADATYSNHFHAGRRNSRVYIYGIGAALAGVLFSWIFGAQLIRIIFGAAYEGAGQYLPYVVLASCVNGISWMLSQSAILGNQQEKLIVRQIGSIVVMAAVMVALRDCGLWGAIVAINLSAFARFATSILIYRSVHPEEAA